MVQAFFPLRLQLFWVPLGKWGRENNYFRPGGWQLFGLHMWKKSGGKEAVVYSDASPLAVFFSPSQEHDHPLNVYSLASPPT